MPQIEIMRADLPHTLFMYDKKKGNKNKKGKPNENYKFNPSDKAVQMQIEANEQMRKRKIAAGKEVQYTMDELFSK